MAREQQKARMHQDGGPQPCVHHGSESQLGQRGVQDESGIDATRKVRQLKVSINSLQRKLTAIAQKGRDEENAKKGGDGGGSGTRGRRRWTANRTASDS